MTVANDLSNENDMFLDTYTYINKKYLWLYTTKKEKNPIESDFFISRTQMQLFVFFFWANGNWLYFYRFVTKILILYLYQEFRQQFPELFPDIYTSKRERPEKFLGHPVHTVTFRSNQIIPIKIDEGRFLSNAFLLEH